MAAYVKTVHVPAIDCDGCVRTIQNEVSAIPGVINVVGDLDTKTVVVEFEPPATWDQIEQTMTEIDYAPEPA